jgi:hypothetical protein
LLEAFVGRETRWGESKLFYFGKVFSRIPENVTVGLFFGIMGLHAVFLAMHLGVMLFSNLV